MSVNKRYRNDEGEEYIYRVKVHGAEHWFTVDEYDEARELADEYGVCVDFM